MNILFVVPDLEWPPRKGYEKLAFERIAHLSQQHRITVLVLNRRPASETLRLELGKISQQTVCIKIPLWRTILSIFRDYLLACEPAQTTLFTYDKGATVASLIKNEQIDIVYALMARSWNEIKCVNVPMVVDLVDCMQVNYKSRIPHMRGVRRWFYQEELRRIQRVENSLVSIADAVLLVSTHDNVWQNFSKVHSIPLGMDTRSFFPRCCAKRYSCVFSGNLSYGPNQDAAVFFINECWPLIRKVVPDAKLLVVGREAPRALEQHRSVPGVTFVGYVEDIAAAICSAHIAVAPMQSGSGMQNKILEAMACGVPVVCTPKGLGAISAKNEKEVLVAESADDLADACCRLLHDEDFRNRLANQALSFVLQNYTIESVLRRLTTIIDNLATVSRKRHRRIVL